MRERQHEQRGALVRSGDDLTNPHRQRRRQAVPADPSAFLRADVEVRVTGGGLVRGRLVEVGDRYLLLNETSLAQQADDEDEGITP